MNVDATYTIEIDGHKLALTHAQAKELYRKLGALIGDGFSEIGRYGHGPYTAPCSIPEGPWKQTPIMCGSQNTKTVLAPVGITIPPKDSGAAIEFAPWSSDVAGATGFCNKFSGSSHTTT